MRSSTQIHDPRPVREIFPEGLGDFQRFFEIFRSFFGLRPPYKGSQPPYEATPLTRGRISDPCTCDSLIKGS